VFNFILSRVCNLRVAYSGKFIFANEKNLQEVYQNTRVSLLLLAVLQVQLHLQPGSSYPPEEVVGAALWVEQPMFYSRDLYC